MAEVSEQVVAEPTYLGDIRYFFDATDIAHMTGVGVGIDLGTYQGVRTHALEIYFQTAPPNPRMPLGKPKWSAERSATFKNWIANGYPLGMARPQAPALAASEAAAPQRVRKNVATLSDDEVATLAKAFTGLMQRRPNDPTSYYALAGLHGLPHAWCMHHDDPFNPWHRAYLKMFEDQLRTIDGCEDVTLPYWDIFTPVPEVLTTGVFASYTLPEDPGLAADPQDPGTYFPYTTQRATPEELAAALQANGVLVDIETSLRQSVWGASGVHGYQQWSIMAHDGGHDSIGPTMADQNVAAYDPIFWFFHSNLDRLWLSWQHLVGATTLQGFRSTIVAPNNDDFLKPPLNVLTPFDTTGDETIDFGIAYDELATPAGEVENTFGSMDAARGFTVRKSTPVSVRVKDIDRLSIPGPFRVNLLADGEVIARRAFFQPRKPQNCSNCRKKALVNIDFRVDYQEIVGHDLTVSIEVPHHEEFGTGFPLATAGNPSVNVRLLLEDE